MSTPEPKNKKELCRFWGVTNSYLDSKVTEVHSIIHHDVDESYILQKLNEYGMDSERVIVDILESKPTHHHNSNPLNIDHATTNKQASLRPRRNRKRKRFDRYPSDDSNGEDAEPARKRRKVMQKMRMLSLSDDMDNSDKENENVINDSQPVTQMNENDNANHDLDIDMDDVSFDTEAKQPSVSVTGDNDDPLPHSNHNKPRRSVEYSTYDDAADSDDSSSDSQSPSNSIFALWRYKNAMARSKAKRDDKAEDIDPTTNTSTAKNKERRTLKRKLTRKPKLWKQKRFNPLKIKYTKAPNKEYKDPRLQFIALPLNPLAAVTARRSVPISFDAIKPIKDIAGVMELHSSRCNGASPYVKTIVHCEYDKKYICDQTDSLANLYDTAFRELSTKPRRNRNKASETQRRDYTIQAHIKKTKELTKKGEKETRRYCAEISFTLNRLQKTGNCFIVDIPATIALTARSQALANDVIDSMHIRDEYTAKGHQWTSISLLDFACRYDNKPIHPFALGKECKMCDKAARENERELPCGHKFCNRCVFRHFVGDDEDQCPVCDREFTAQEIVKLVDLDAVLHSEDENDDEEEEDEKELITERQKRYGLNVIAFPYQVQSIEWMLERETDEEGLYQYLFKKGSFKNGEAFYYSAVLKRLVLAEQLPVLHGGFLCEEMGLGKTIECLAVIHCNTRSDTYSTAKQLVVARKETALRKKRVEIKTKAPMNEEEAFSLRPKKKKKVYKFVEERKEYTYYKGKGTLIIAPVSLIGQWEHEVDTRSNGNLTYKRYYGSRSRNIKHYLNTDIIFTTFGVLAKEDGHDRKTHVLHRIEWHRIILDESHYIKNGAARTSININELKGNNKWLLSGTPFNAPCDLVNQFKFIGLEPEYINAMKLKDHVLFPNALLKMVRHAFIRHKKGQKFNKKPICTMGDKEEDIIYVEFDAKQKEYYNKLYATAKECFDSYKATGNIARGFIPILSSLHPARQACSGYIGNMNAIEQQLSAAQENSHKIRSIVERNKHKSSKELYQMARIEAYNKDGQCVICLECPPDEPLQTPCHHIFCGDCIRTQLEENGECPICRTKTDVHRLKLPLSEKKEEENESANDDNINNNNNGNKESETENTETVIKFDAKLKVLINELNTLKRERPDDKSLIFTSFSKSLDWICCELDRNGIEYCTLTGSMPMNKRAKNLKTFSTSPNIKVFVLTVRTGAVGLTLTAANHVFMMEPTFNPALHRQAINRVYRLGQEKKVFIHTLIMKESIEERIWNLNKDKQKGDIDNNKNKNMYGNIKDDKAGALQSTEIEKLFEDSEA